MIGTHYGEETLLICKIRLFADYPETPTYLALTGHLRAKRRPNDLAFCQKKPNEDAEELFSDSPRPHHSPSPLESRCSIFH